MQDNGDQHASPDADETERKRLELEKLRLDTEAARAAKGLAAEKLRLDIEQAKKGDVRATVASFSSVFLGLATLFLGLSGFFLNATINHAAEQQRAFDNYTKLTDEFAKGGSGKVGAIVGFRAFLKPGSDRAEQTIELLADDLLKEHDVVTRLAIVRALSASGMQAFGRVRQLNSVTRERMRQAALAVLFEGDFELRGKRQGGIADVATLLYDAANQYEPDATKDLLRWRGDELNDMIILDSEGTVSEEGMRLSQTGGPHHKSAYWVNRYSADAPAFLATVEILRALLQQNRAAGLRNLDASGIAVFGVDLRDADLSGVDFRNSYLKGIANGADLSGANLTNAIVYVDLHRSAGRGTSLCGAILTGATLHLPTIDLPVDSSVPATNKPVPPKLIREELPNLTAANWWDMYRIIVPGDTTYPEEVVNKTLQASFPRNNELAAKSADEKKRSCDQARYEQKGASAPEAGLDALQYRHSL